MSFMSEPGRSGRAGLPLTTARKGYRPKIVPNHSLECTGMNQASSGKRVTSRAPCSNLQHVSFCKRCDHSTGYEH